MKGYKSFIAAVLTLSSALAGCENFGADDHKFDNAVYLNISETNEVQMTTFSNNAPEVVRDFQLTLAYPSAQNVTVDLTVDESLTAVYNARYGTQWPVLDQKYYELSTDKVTIPAGKTTSEVVSLRLKELMGQGEQQTGALPIDETYLLPVRISNASLDVLDGSSKAYYVVKRSSAITTAAQLTNNWIEFPSLDVYSENSMAWNELKAMTYEALIYIDDFAAKDPENNPVSISTVMGIEDYLLLRIGDTNFERQQLQFDGSGAKFGKFPGRDATKTLEKGRWYHVACTYDQQTHIVRIYVDGKIQSEGREMGVLIPDADGKDNLRLARRALYDLWDKANPTDKETYEKLQYNTMSDARQFFISFSYNDYRPLNGKIAEARVWSVARTPEQIWDNMYKIENPKDDATLLGYWKFSEGKGNEVKDFSRYGHDGKAKYNLMWPSGIEIPEINKTEK